MIHNMCIVIIWHERIFLTRTYTKFTKQFTICMILHLYTWLFFFFSLFFMKSLIMHFACLFKHHLISFIFLVYLCYKHVYDSILFMMPFALLWKMIKATTKLSKATTKLSMPPAVLGVWLSGTCASLQVQLSKRRLLGTICAYKTLTTTTPCSRQYCRPHHCTRIWQRW